MTGSDYVLTRTLVITLLLAVLLTVVVAPALVSAFRRKVTASMKRAASTKRAPTTKRVASTKRAAQAAALRPPTIPRPTGPARWLPAGYGYPQLPRVQAGAAIRANPREQALRRHTRRTLNRLAIAYGCGGAAQATVMTLFVLLGGQTVYSRPLVWLSVWLVMALPVVATVAYVLSTRPAARSLWVAGALAATLVFSGEARGLVWALFLPYILVPAALFLLFNLRFWRATAPLVLVLALGGSLGWLGLIEIGKLAVGEGVAMWGFRLLGLAAGVLLALPVARWIGRGYQARRTSEQMLFVDAWWALLTSIQTAALVIMDGQVGKMLALTGFGAYLLVSRALLHGLRTDRRPAARLLLLRVFGHDRRTERLLDELTQRWRPFGTVDLIAGRDLALRNIDPSEFYTFLTGRLDREFVQGPVDLDQRLAGRDDRPDPDGRYRINQFFCHVDTWQLTLDRLVDRCDAVLMDLRGFDEARAGCLYEIGRLAEHAGARPIVLLVDADTNLELAESTFLGPAQRRPPAAPGCQVFILASGPSGRATVDTAIALLLNAQPA
jgi:hypothetical protein